MVTPLAVNAVRGDTDATTVPAASNGAQAPGGYWATHGFVATGAGFDTTLTAQLLQGGKKFADLVVSDVGATTFIATLPPTLVAGTYSLRVATDAQGSVALDNVSILQGPPGPAGNGATVAAPISLAAAAPTNPALTVSTGVVDFSATTAAVKLPWYRCMWDGNTSHAITYATVAGTTTTPPKACQVGDSGFYIALECGTGDLLLTGGCEYATGDTAAGLSGLDTSSRDQTYVCSGKAAVPKHISVTCLVGAL